MTAAAVAAAGEHTSRPVFGTELRLDLAGCDPQVINDRDELLIYVGLLIEKIGMTAYGQPVAEHFGEGEAIQGWTVMQMITTSLISFHTVDADRSAFINIFSCRPFDPAAARDFTVGFFGAAKYIDDFKVRFAPELDQEARG